MKKFLLLFALTILLSAGQIMAIGLPNTSFIQRHAAKQAKLHNVRGDVQKYQLIIEAKDTYSAEKNNTLDSDSDFQDFSKAVIDKVVNFVSMLILSLASVGNSIADNANTAQSWITTGLPPQV